MAEVIPKTLFTKQEILVQEEVIVPVTKKGSFFYRLDDTSFTDPSDKVKISTFVSSDNGASYRFKISAVFSGGAKSKDGSSPSCWVSVAPTVNKIKVIVEKITGNPDVGASYEIRTPLIAVRRV